MNGKIIIRADASSIMGSGHIMRTIALGQMLKARGFEVHFVCREQKNTVFDRIKKEGFLLHWLENSDPWNKEKDLTDLIRIGKQLHIRWVIVDGYHFDTDYQKRIKAEGFQLMSIDDIADCEYVSDIILNQNSHARRNMYRAQDYTIFFLGPQYSLIRGEFLTAAENYERSIKPTAQNILVTMGGGDPENVTLTVIKALGNLSIPELKVKILVGGLNKYIDEIRSYCETSVVDVEVLFNLTDELPSLMKWADIAISAGGSSLWEFALFATPVLTIILAQNQEALVRELDRKGAVVSLGWHHHIDQIKLAEKVNDVMRNVELRQQLSNQVHKEVGNRQINRVLDLLER